MPKMIRLTGLIPLLIVLTACPVLPVATNVQGDWAGTLTDSATGKSINVSGVIEENGAAFLYASDGEFFALSPLVDTSAESGTLSQIELSGNGCSAPNPCGVIGVYGFSGTASATAINLTATESDVYPGGTVINPPPVLSISLMRAAPYSGTAQLPSGALQGYYLPGNLSVGITVNPDGSFAGSDAFGCSLSGTLKQIGTDNLFKVSVQGAYSTSGSCNGSYSGLAYLSDTGSGDYSGVSGSYLYMFEFSGSPTLNSSIGVFVTELKVR